MGPTAIASLGATPPITGLGAAAALCRVDDTQGFGQAAAAPVSLPLSKQPVPQNREP